MKYFLVAVVLTVLVLFEARCITSDEEPPDPTVTDQVFFNITIGGEFVGQIIIGLFGHVVPYTVKNFKTLAEGTATDKQGKVLWYKGSRFHRIISNFMIQGGDITEGNGYGFASIYGGNFRDENFKLKHYGSGWMSMANAGKDTNGCQFAIYTVMTPWLDNHHVVFGLVLEGMDIVHRIEWEPRDNHDRPLKDIIISDSGSLNFSTPFTVPKRPTCA